MGLFDGIFKRGGTGHYQAYDPFEMALGARAFSDAFFETAGHPHITQSNAYHLALSLAEIAFPIDIIADRVATLKYNLVNSSNKIIETAPPAVARLMDKPNAFASLPTLMYDAAFILMSDGNLLGLRTRPELFKDSPLNPDNIFSITIPQPHSYTIQWHNHLRQDLISNIGELIDYIRINEECHQIYHRGIDAEFIGNGGSFQYNHAYGYGYRSPLLSAERNINNLLVVYQARYRAYTDNPMGIILSPRNSPGTDIASVALGRDQTDKIHADLARRYGITGYDISGEKKKMWAITSTALQATKTLATISELQPFEETREDALQIAGLFDVDNSLVPTREKAAFTTDNKEAAEANLYDGIITSMANDVADFFTRLMALDKVGLKLVPDMTQVPILQKRRLQRAQGDSQVIDLLIKMRDAGLATDADIKNISDRIINNLKI